MHRAAIGLAAAWLAWCPAASAGTIGNVPDANGPGEDLGNARPVSTTLSSVPSSAPISPQATLHEAHPAAVGAAPNGLGTDASDDLSGRTVRSLLIPPLSGAGNEK
jgi:hypothetical protein